jgi:hypothetical protein
MELESRELLFLNSSQLIKTTVAWEMGNKGKDNK